MDRERWSYALIVCAMEKIKIDIFADSRASTDACARDCQYNKNTDIERIVDGLSIELADALKSGKVPPIEIPDTENGLTSPDFIQGRLQDAFDAAESVAAARARQEQHKANKSNKAAAAATAAAAAAAAATPPA